MARQSKRDYPVRFLDDCQADFTKRWRLIFGAIGLSRKSQKEGSSAAREVSESPNHLNDFNGGNRSHHRSGFGSTGKPAACQASQPPISARALVHPAFFNSRATRALVASSGQAQNAKIQV
jgi:hypothetical protein